MKVAPKLKILPFGGQTAMNVWILGMRIWASPLWPTRSLINRHVVINGSLRPSRAKIHLHVKTPMRKRLGAGKDGKKEST